MVRSEFKLRFVGVSGLHEVLPSIGSVLPERELPEIFVEELIEAASRYLVEPKPENLRWAYKNEVSIQMITKLIHETIDGAGFRLEGDPRACEFVQGVYDSTVNLSEWLEITTENLVISLSPMSYVLCLPRRHIKSLHIMNATSFIFALAAEAILSARHL